MKLKIAAVVLICFTAVMWCWVGALLTAPATFEKPQVEKVAVNYLGRSYMGDEQGTGRPHAIYEPKLRAEWDAGNYTNCIVGGPLELKRKTAEYLAVNKAKLEKFNEMSRFQNIEAYTHENGRMDFTRVTKLNHYPPGMAELNGVNLGDVVALLKRMDQEGSFSEETQARLNKTIKQLESK